jgi:hypothetical protein
VRRSRGAALLLPFLLSGCGVLDTLTGGGTPAATGAPSPAPGASPWIVTATGSATPAPSPSYPSVSPSALPGFLPLPSAGPAPAPSATCPPVTFNFARIGPLAVTPGTTTAKVSFYNLGGYNLLQFRLTATSQHLRLGAQRDIGWLTITPAAPCGQVVATVTGLDRKTGYVFSVDAVVTRRAGDGPRAATVFRSGVVYTK